MGRFKINYYILAGAFSMDFNVFFFGFIKFVFLNKFDYNSETKIKFFELYYIKLRKLNLYIDNEHN